MRYLLHFVRPSTVLLILAVLCGSTAAVQAQEQWANRVVDFSSQYGTDQWSAAQALGAPDVYPAHEDNPLAWASGTSNDQREHLVLGYATPQPVNTVRIYETFHPGAVDTVYVKNPTTGQFEMVWSGTAAPAPLTARAFEVTFPTTSYTVDEVRIALNSPVVPDWNEIDAVSIEQQASGPVQDLTVTDGLLEDRVELNWQSEADGSTRLQIERDGNLLAVLSRSATSYTDATGEPGIAYAYCVVTTAADGTVIDRACGVGRRVVFSPTALNATDRTRTDGVRVTWADRSAREAGYRVFRRNLSAADSVEIADLAPNTGLFDDTAADPLTAYRYCAVAYDADGYTSEARCDEGTRGAIAPAANVLATDGERPYVRVTWDAGAAQNAIVSRDGVDLATLVGTATSYADATAADGQTYTYCVVFQDGGGTSVPVCDDGTPTLAPPTDVTATLDTFDDRVEIAWAYTGSAHDGFEIYRRADGTADSTRIDSTGALDRSLVDADAVPGESYTYSVQAVSSDDPAAPNRSAAIQVAGRRAGVLAPTDVIASDGTFEDRVELAWASTSTSVMLFNVYRDGVLVETPAPDQPSFVDRAIPSDTDLAYCVTSMTVLGASAAVQTQVAEVVRMQLQAERAPLATVGPASVEDERAALLAAVQETLDAAASASLAATEIVESDPVCTTGSRSINAPAQVQASYDQYEDHVQLSWTNRSAVQQGFNLYRSTDAALGTLIAQVGPSRTAYGDYEGIPGQDYTYRVVAYDADGASLPTSDAGRRTLLAPTGFQASDGLSETMAELTWADNSRAEDGYRIYRDDTQIGEVGDNQVRFVDTLAVTGGVVGAVYTYSVRAFDAFGTSAAATDQGAAGIVAPTSVLASDFYEDDVVLTWLDASENEEGFQIYQDGEIDGRRDGRAVLLATKGANVTSHTEAVRVPQTVIPTAPLVSDVALDLEAGRLYYGDVSGLHRSNLDGTDVEDIGGDLNIEDLALDLAAGKLYWLYLDCSTGPCLISGKRSNLDGSAEEVLDLATNSATALQVDTAASKLYWIDRTGSRILRQDLAAVTTSTPPEEVATGVGAGALVLDPEAGYLYWIDGGVWRAELADPLNTKQEIITEFVTTGNGRMALDAEAGQVYWSNDFDGNIRRIDLDGSNLTEVIAGLNAPLGIALTSGTLFWVEKDGNTVRRASLGAPAEYCVVAFGGAVTSQAVCDGGGVPQQAPPILETPTVDADNLLTADPAEVGALYGLGVAIDGEVALIGSANGGAAGKVYAYRRVGAEWHFQEVLIGSGGAPYDPVNNPTDAPEGIASIAIDGDYAILGDPSMNDFNLPDAGGVYFLKRDGNGWREVVRLQPPAGNNDENGFDVSINGDVAASIGDTPFGYLYERQGLTWAWTQFLRYSDSDAYDGNSANAVRAISIDDEYVLTSRMLTDTETGVLYIYKRNPSTGAWGTNCELAGVLRCDESQRIELTAPGTISSIAHRQGWAAVGVRTDDTGGQDAGAVYLFKLDGATWTFQQRLTANMPIVGELFGWDVAFEGEYLAVGAPNASDKGGRSGAVYLYRLNDEGGWEEILRRTPSTARGEQGTDAGQLGFEIALSDGDVFYGAPTYGNPAYGAVYTDRLLLRPLSLQASDGGFSDRIQLTWADANVYNDGFEVFRLDADGVPVSIGTVSAEADTYDDFEAAPGGTYAYCIAAVNRDLQNEVTKQVGTSNMVCDTGWRPPNGSITGRVAARGGGGTADVTVCPMPAINRALLLDGVGGDVLAQGTGDAPLALPAAGFTIEFWAKVSQEGFVVSHGVLNVANQGLHVGFRSLTNFTVAFWGNDLNAPIDASTDWHHWAVTYDAVSGERRMYRDLELIGSDVATSPYAGRGDVHIGSLMGTENGAGLGFFGGQVDELRIWEGVRTLPQLRDRHRERLAGDEPGLFAYWPFDEGIGRTTADQTGRGLNAQLNGGADWSPAGAFKVCAVTDIDGNFTLSDIRYGEAATLTLTPALDGHTFDPRTKQVTLATESPVQNEVGFIDETNFAVTGRVRFGGASYLKNECPVVGAEILVDGEVLGQTQRDGTYALSLPPARDGNDRRGITPRFVGSQDPPDPHPFTPARYDTAVTQPLLDLDFIDTKLRPLTLSYGGSCPAVTDLGTASVKIFTENGCFLEEIDLTSGQTSIALPPQRYLVQVEDVTGIPAGVDQADVIQYFDNLGAQEVDLTVAPDTLDLVYRAPLAIQFVQDLPAGPSCTTLTDGQRSLPTGLPVLAERSAYTVQVQVVEDYGDGVSCPLTAGTVRLFDGIGDQEEPTAYNLAELADGRIRYTGRVGEPNIFPGARVDGVDRSYQKSLNVIAEVPGREPVTATRWAYVEGSCDRGETFITGGDPMLMHVVHDPPGDGSYGYIEKGSTICRTLRFESAQTINNSYDLQVQFGFVGEKGLFVTTETEVVAGGQFHFNAGVAATAENELTTCITTEERIATSAEPNFTGPPADVFLGVGLNFAVGEQVTLDVATNGDACSIGLDTDFAIGVDGEQPFETIFGYTRAHIEHVLIPQLYDLVADESLSRQERSRATMDIIRWTGLLGADTDRSSDDYELIENRSYSAGADLEYAVTRSQSQLAGFGSTDVVLVEAGGFANVSESGNGFELVALYATEVEVNETLTDTKEDELKVGYVLFDDELGDYFSFDVGRAVKLREQPRQLPYLQDVIRAQADLIGESSWDDLEDQCEAVGNTDGEDDFFSELGDCYISSIATLGTALRDQLRKGLAGVDDVEIRCQDEQGSPVTCSFPDGEEAFPNLLYHPGGEMIFTLRGGASSRPWQAGTKKRDQARIGPVQPPERLGVPADQAAAFTLPLTNDSETGETREYILRSIHTANENGAILTANGAFVQNGISFYLDPDQTTNVTLKVERGPTSYTYDDLAVQLYPAGEYPVWEDGGVNGNGIIQLADTATFSVQFEAPCTEIGLLRPKDRWFYNRAMQQAGTPIDVILHDYTIAPELVGGAENLDQLFLRAQYRREGSPDWFDIFEARGDTLTASSIAGTWTPPQDGAYELRAMSQCGGADQRVISDAVTGQADTAPPVVFGTPEPADQVLTLGADIGLSFNEPIDCGSVEPSDVSLTLQTESGPVPVTGVETVCDGTTLLLTPPATFDWAAAEGLVIDASVTGVTDRVGNAMGTPATWSFTVQRSAFAFSPVNIVATASRGVGRLLETSLVNGKTEAVDFTVPGPLTLERVDAAGTPTGPTVDLAPSASDGTIPPGGSYPITYAVPDTLALGRWTGQTAATGSIGGSTIGTAPFFADVTVACTAPAWTIDPSQFEFTMSLTAELFIKASGRSVYDASTDANDTVVALVNGEVRGVGTNQAIGGGAYRVSMLLYSNDPGETVTFQVWDDDTCTFYEETSLAVSFTANGTQGTAAQPVTLQAPAPEPAGLALAAGWTWLSINTVPADPSVATLFAGLGTVGDLVKSQTAFSQYDEVFGWFGSLFTLEAGAAYLAKLSRSGDLTVGGPAVPFDAPINVTAGWNWIGYQPQTAQPLSTAFDGTYAFQAGDLIKSQFAFAQYDGSQWVGSLTQLEPGQGYLLNVASGGTLTYSEPPASALARTGDAQQVGLQQAGAHVDGPTAGHEAPSPASADTSHRTDEDPEVARAEQPLTLASCLFPDPTADTAPADLTAAAGRRPLIPGAYTHTMTLTAALTLGEQPFIDTAACVTLRSGEDLRALGRVQYVAALDRHLAFLTVYGTEVGGEPLTLDVHHPDWTVPIGEATGLTYAPDAVLGSLQEPRTITLTRPDELPVDYALEQNYPNPFNPQTTIRYALPEPGAVTLTLYDVLGRRLAVLVRGEQKAGWHTFAFDAAQFRLASGVYFYKIETPGFQQVHKMVLLR